MCADTADEFGAGSCREKDGVTDVIDGKTNGNSNLFEVHTDERTTDIETCVCADLFNSNRIFEMCVCRGSEGAACLGLRNNVDDICKGNCRFFDDDRAVQMFAALCRDEDSLGGKYARKSLKDGFRGFGAGGASDLVTANLAGGTADDDDIAFFQLGDFANIVCRLRGLISDFIQYHFYNLTFVGYNISYFTARAFDFQVFFDNFGDFKKNNGNPLTYRNLYDIIMIST